ncbi:MAG TPA: Tol-Pal system beta propeller repeat protein TolB [Thermodesulfobacteriota bacterium]|nr:Tol-Pal system beta propeller repeat protein TolB [Thermodesulfobacteriota bacterium]
MSSVSVRRPLTVLAALLLALAPAAAGPAGEGTGGKVYIEINPLDQRRLPIAVTEFVPAGAGDRAVGRQLAEVIGADLAFTGLFRVLDPAGFVEDPAKAAFTVQEIDFRDWTSVGAEALVKGRYRLDGTTLRVEARLFDPLKAQQLFAREYSGEARATRRLAHRIASDVLEALAGERGVFETRIAFVSNRTGTKELYVMDYDGHNARRLTTGGSINLVPAWSPDGRQLAFVSYLESHLWGKPDLWFLQLDTGALRRLRLPFEWRGSFNGGVWSPRGDLFAFSVSREGNSDIYVMRLDGSGLRPLAPHFALDVAPSFSPDGRQVVFMSDRAGNPHLYIADVGGDQVRRLTFEGKYNGSPAWSPRGDRIAFTCRDDRGRFDICVIAPDGSGLARLTSEGNNEAPSWSPDGRFIVFQSDRDGADRLYVMHANGAGQRRLVPVLDGPPGEDTQPAWSPLPPR